MAELFAQPGDADFFARCHGLQALSRFFFPGGGFLAEADEKSGSLTAFFFGKPGEALLEVQQGDGGHGSTV